MDRKALKQIVEKFGGVMGTVEIAHMPDHQPSPRRLDLPNEHREAMQRLERLKQQPQQETNFLENDPVLSLEVWYPVFHQLHLRVASETKGFDYRWVKDNRPKLHRRIKTIEDRIDALQEVRLSTVLSTMREWRELVLKAYFEQRETKRESV